MIGLPANLFYSTGIEVCILILKKCKKPDDVLFINAEKHFQKGKRQNYLTDAHIDKIIDTYQRRKEERYSKRVELSEIEANDWNLNISRYVSTAEPEAEIDLAATHEKLVEIENEIREATQRHNGFLEELGLPLMPNHILARSREFARCSSDFRVGCMKNQGWRKRNADGDITRSEEKPLARAIDTTLADSELCENLRTTATPCNTDEVPCVGLEPTTR